MVLCVGRLDDDGYTIHHHVDTATREDALKPKANFGDKPNGGNLLSSVFNEITSA